jgi:hypothetical protein
MASETEVQQFLNEFHQKLRIWEILFRDDRQKNIRTLLRLEISTAKRKEIIESLKLIDYSEGPLHDTLNSGPPLWVFGKTVKHALIYIKITIGTPNNPVICISFHEAEHPMNFPFKVN